MNAKDGGAPDAYLEYVRVTTPVTALALTLSGVRNPTYYPTLRLSSAFTTSTLIPPSTCTGSGKVSMISPA